MFSMEEATLIKFIPLNSNGIKDKIVWHHTKNSLFIVRSAYQLHMDIQECADYGSSISRDGKAWKSLWRLKVHNSVKMFFWIACLDILPTLTNLKQRNIVEKDECPIFFRKLEIAGHILWA